MLPKKSSTKIAVITLLAFLFSGIGSTSLFPVLITTLAHAHPVFISEGDHKIQMILHHPGNHDEHEVRENVVHHHDLLDAVVGVSKSNQASHTDHVVDVPSFREKVSASTKSFVDADTLSFLANIQILPISSEQDSGHHWFRFLSEIDPLNEPLRTAILRI